jgi:hypothetical protein
VDEGRRRHDNRPGRSDDDVHDDWETFRERVDRERRSRQTAGTGRVAQQDDPAAWLSPNEISAPGMGAAEFDLDDFRERLLGGPGSELFGGSGGPFYDSAGGGFSPFGPPDRPPEPEPAQEPLTSALPQQARAERANGRVDAVMEDSGLVRPYFRTKGRTRPAYDLAIEALVSTSEQGRVLDRVQVPEHRSICDLCLDTRSVAEVAALLRLPLGVVRVLIGDVAGLGLVLVHSAGTTVGDRPSIEFMERVLSGLRRI